MAQEGEAPGAEAAGAEDCRLCALTRSDNLLATTPHAVAVLDTFPVSPGHSLVVPRRHEANFFRLTPAELADVWTLAAQVERLLRARYLPDGMNVGVNVGAAAGQGLAHTVVHLIPRYAGDVSDPRGGVRRMLMGRLVPGMEAL
jgi:diadenosine tetraphosphate (Ap4A) HIT family hydrolase